MPATVSQETELPSLKPEALWSLTKKIEVNLKKAPVERASKTPQLKPPKARKTKDSNSRPTELSEAKVKTTAKSRNGGVTQSAPKLPLPVPQRPEGKKRFRDGQIKGPDNSRSEVNKIKVTGRESSKASRHNLNIEEEILALGGTKDDYQLIADALSDSEIEGNDMDIHSVPLDDMQRELLRLVKELGVEKAHAQEQGDPQGEEQDDSFEDGDRDSNPLNVPPRINGNGEKSTLQLTGATGKGSSYIFFEPQSDWHAAALPRLPTLSQNAHKLPQELSERIHQHAKSLLELENKQYASWNGSSSSAQQFYSTIMSSGTLSDKISALTLSVQESPVHNMKALENLVGLARKRSRGQAVEVLGALKDLFGPGALLPSDRKLKVFAGQPGLSAVFNSSKFNWKLGDPLPKPLKEIHLLLWAYEDWLKSTFFEVLKIIETWCNDEVVFARSKAVDYVCQLLKEKPEQEANLLRLLVNKLGDSDKKIASRTSYSILQLENTHPLMKSTIIASIESDLLFRPGQSLHAKYYAIITLNQTVLSGKEDGVARKLLDIYFDLFIKLLERPEAAKPVISGANAIAVNRKGQVQGGGGSSGKKALQKQALKEKDAMVGEDLREKMLSAVLTGVNRAIPFIATDDESFERHLDTLFRVTHSSNFNTSVQALMLIQQLSSSRQGSADRFYRTLYESLLDPRLLTSSKQALYLNLLFRALRSDLNVRRVKAFAKRLLQVMAMHQPAFTCGALYLLRELEGVFANLQAFIDQPEEGDSDEEENFKDVREDVDDVQHSPKITTMDTDKTVVVKDHSSRLYDGRKRDPEYSNAEHSCLWELTPFLMHFHPSVALFASRLLKHEPMPPKPDLLSHTLIHFLDRFVYRNAKVKGGSKGTSIMQPMAGGDASGILVSARSKTGIKAPVNSEAFWRMEGAKVEADEVFFHKYFSTLGRGKEQAKKKKADRTAEADVDSEGDDEDEEEIWKALVDSRPELEGSDQSDDDLGMEGLDSADGSEDDGVEDAGFAELDVGDVQPDLDFSKDEDAPDLEEYEDEAFLDSDDEVPSDLDKAFAKEMQSNMELPALIPAGEKRGSKRRRLKNLPTFASAEDYADMLDKDDQDV